MPATPLNPYINSLIKLPLWVTFFQKAEADELVMVTSVVTMASERLDAVRDTFKTYTIHNAIHSLNVVRLMGSLLGTEIREYLSLGAAILILSAFLHDIGMVFEDSEKEDIVRSSEWDIFLEEDKYSIILL